MLRVLPVVRHLDCNHIILAMLLTTIPVCDLHCLTYNLLTINPWLSLALLRTAPLTYLHLLRRGIIAALICRFDALHQMATALLTLPKLVEMMSLSIIVVSLFFIETLSLRESSLYLYN